MQTIFNFRKDINARPLSIVPTLLATIAFSCVGVLSVGSSNAAPQKTQMQFNKRSGGNQNIGSIPKSNIGVGRPSPYNRSRSSGRSSAYRNSAVRNYSKGPTVDFRSGNNNGHSKNYSYNRTRPTNGIYVSPNTFGYRGRTSSFYRPTFGNGIYGSGVYSPGVYGTNIYSRNIYGSRPLGYSSGLQTYPNTYTIPNNYNRPTYPYGVSVSGSAARADLLNRPTSSTAPTRSTISNQFYAKIPTSASARTHQNRAEQAFKSGDYAQAAELVQIALSLDPNNGRLQLFASHTNFSVGKFTQAANHLNDATRTLSSDQWGTVVKNFRDFYGKNDYVAQTDRLSQNIATQPTADALAIRGYHYGSLGYAEAATVDFQQAISIDPNHGLAKRLLPVLGIAPQPVSPEQIEAPVPSIVPVADDLNNIIPLTRQSNRPDDGIIRLVPQFSDQEIQTAVPAEMVPAPVADSHSIMLQGPSK